MWRKPPIHRNGVARAEDYRSLRSRGTSGGRLGDVGDKNVAELMHIYMKAIEKTYKRNDFKLVPFIRAFLNACKGGALPVHYPRKSPAPNPAGENFEWFVDNEKNQKLSLPPLEEDQRGLPT
ncbi:MAG: hypothetical protein ACYDC8_14730 [Gammaproteobacteria bacterium]